MGIVNDCIVGPGKTRGQNFDSDGYNVIVRAGGAYTDHEPLDPPAPYEQDLD